jgi:chemosensory pili system protein ChpA (sensor histidine kinase/response regulator)
MLPGELLEVFLQDGWEGLTVLEAGIGDLRADPANTDGRDDARYSAFSLIAHRLRGSAGLYGYPQLAGLATIAERLTESQPRLAAPEREQLLDVLELVTLGLRRALDELGAGRGEGEVGLFFAQVGGAASLQALLRAAPSAFSLARTHGNQPGQTSSSGSAPLLSTPTNSGLTAELQAFAQQNREVWSYFAPEVSEYLEALRGELDRGAQGNVTLMFRAAHTIKGSAYMVGLAVMGDFAHRLEDLLIAVREQGLALGGTPSALLGLGVTLLERMVTAAEGRTEVQTSELERLKTQVTALLQGQVAPPEPSQQEAGEREQVAQTDLQPQRDTVPVQAAQSIRVNTQRLDAIMDGVGQLVMSRARLERGLERLTRLEESLSASHSRVQRVVRDFEERYLNPDMVRSDSFQDAASGLRGTVQGLFEELEFDSYDDMNILARSVTELSADLSELQQQFRAGSAALRDETDTFSRLLRSLRGDVARTRRVPLSQAYSRPRRWARGQRQAEIVTLGGDQEVDAYVTQGLSEVLLHLVTNAFTHGLEPQDSRERLGKPTLGRVIIDARRRGTQLDVSVSDDGRGIDVQAVRDQALARGLRSARELEGLSDEDALRLIFLPGLSTSREVTSEAGRGVGMDIVASTMRRLGGELLVRSVAGQGTTFTLRVPLTQQVVDLLTVRVGPYPLGFPAGSIVTLREVPQDAVRVQDGQPVLEDGTPLHLLQPVWDLPAPTGALNVVVLDTTAGLVAFAVDSFEGIAEAVILPPGPFLDALGYIAGTTVTPDGEPVLLPDASGLARQATRLWTGGQMLQSWSGSNPIPQARRLLLVDDSLSVRRVVSRLLERAGYQVVTASDGQEALDLLRQDTQFHAILTDLEMPRVNGFEVIEDVRRRDSSIPIIVMTTRAGEKHQQLAFQLGASDYFSKPVDESLLTRCLERLIVPQDVRRS